MKSILGGVVAAFLSLFGAPHSIVHTTSTSPSQAAAAAVTQDIATTTGATSTGSPAVGGGTSTTTVVNDYITRPIVERVVAATTTGVSEAELDSKLNQLENKLTSLIYNWTGIQGGTPASPVTNSVGAGGVWNAIAATNKIDKLSGVTISNSTIDGASIPDLSRSYLSVNGGTLSGTLHLTNASSSQFSIFNSAYFGGTATSSFDSAGALTLATALALTSGGTGATSTTTARSNLGLAYASSADIINNTHIATWGDSLTAGTSGNIPYPTDLAQLTGYSVYNGGVGGETSAQIKSRFDAATSKWSWPTVIWAGRNDGCSISAVETNIAGMVSELQSVGNNNYLILGVINGTTEGSGTGAYTCITNLNSYLSSTYGTHFLDVRSYLVSLYDPNQAQDVIDHANDTPPTSLRSTGDTLHLNSAGYKAVASYIYQSFSILQPANSSTIFTPSNILNLFANPPTIGSTTPGAAYFSRLAIGTTTNYSALTLDAGGNASANAITFSGLLQGSNTIIGLKNQASNIGWSIRASGGSQEFFKVADPYLTDVFQINTASSSNPSFYNPSSTSAPFGFGTTTVNSNSASRVAISAGAYNSGSAPLLTFVDLPSSPPPILGVRTASGNAGWTITASGGSDEFFNLKNGTATTLQFYTGSSGTFSSYWNPGNASGAFGFGTTTPWAKVSIAGSPGGTLPLFTVSTSTSGFATSTALIVDKNGQVGVASSTPWRAFSVTGTVGFDGLTGNFGAGSLCLTANKEVVYNSGSDSCLSSLRSTKHDIQPLDLAAIDMVKSLQPVSFIYNNDASSTVRYGFIAEDTAAVDPHLGTYDQAGNISGVDDRSMLAIIVRALQSLIGTVGSFADSLTTKELTFARATGDEIDVQKTQTHMLCIDDVCVTRDQLAALVGSTVQNPPNSDSSSGSVQQADASSGPPVISINGSNPAVIQMGASYSDLGATITGPQADLNLGIQTFLNGALASNIVVDTSAAATDTIDYVVTDQNGLTSTSTRTVIIQAADTPSIAPDETASSTDATATSTATSTSQ